MPVVEWYGRTKSLMSHMGRIHAKGQVGLRALSVGLAVEDVKKSLYLAGTVSRCVLPLCGVLEGTCVGNWGYRTI
jgi:hypothetical protein